MNIIIDPRTGRPVPALEQARKKMVEITADDLATAYTGSTVTVIVEFADSERIEITRGVMKGDAPGRAG
jgi:hypothetical protein